MDQYIPPIHETFRRRGYPIERAGKVHQVTFSPNPATPAQLTEQQRWDCRNKDETWSILLTRDTVILQTTAYTRFEDFAERLRMAVHTVLAESEHDRLGVVHRVGLRYIDVVRASGGKGFRFYLRPGLHGVGDEVFQPGQHLLHTESRGRTVVGGNPGTMVVRIVQNDQGSPLPPDLVDAAPSLSPRAEAGELVTLIDMDHFVEGNFDADPDWVVARAYETTGHARTHGWGTTPRVSGDFLAAAVRSSPPLQLDRDPLGESVRSSRLPPLERPARPRAHRTSRPIPRTEIDPLL